MNIAPAFRLGQKMLVNTDAVLAISRSENQFWRAIPRYSLLAKRIPILKLQRRVRASVAGG
jgi:predicted DCC family thiol-disulfide oxidoreductase YuxK